MMNFKTSVHLFVNQHYVLSFFFSIFLCLGIEKLDETYEAIQEAQLVEYFGEDTQILRKFWLECY